MKNLMMTLSLVFVTTSASAEMVKVCSIGRDHEIYTTVLQVEGNKAVMIQDGTNLYYDVVSAKDADLKRTGALLSKDAGRTIVVIHATQYTMKDQLGTTRFQIAIDSNYNQYMIFTDSGIVGAKSTNCGDEQTSLSPKSLLNFTSFLKG